jgi:phage-related protein
MTDNLLWMGHVRIKQVEWIKGSRRAVQAFPPEARNRAGNQLWLLQLGRCADDWKPMPDIGPGAIEIRIHMPHEHRLICVAKYPEVVYVLHGFAKKTQRTPQRDLRQARVAYIEMRRMRDG